MTFLFRYPEAIVVSICFEQLGRKVGDPATSDVGNVSRHDRDLSDRTDVKKTEEKVFFSLRKSTIYTTK